MWSLAATGLVSCCSSGSAAASTCRPSMRVVADTAPAARKKLLRLIANTRPSKAWNDSRLQRYQWSGWVRTLGDGCGCDAHQFSPLTGADPCFGVSSITCSRVTGTPLTDLCDG